MIPPLLKILYALNLFFSIYFLHLYKGIQLYLVKILSFLKFDNSLVELANPTMGYINIVILLTFLLINLTYYKKLSNK